MILLVNPFLRDMFDSCWGMLKYSRPGHATGATTSDLSRQRRFQWNKVDYRYIAEETYSCRRCQCHRDEQCIAIKAYLPIRLVKSSPTYLGRAIATERGSSLSRYRTVRGPSSQMSPFAELVTPGRRGRFTVWWSIVRPPGTPPERVPTDCC
jgi:hypothetical protein